MRFKGRPKRRLLAGLALAAAGVAFYACAAVQLTGATASPDSAKIERAGAADARWTGGDTLSVVTWNLGYGGLGEGSDFFADGGRAYLPPSRRAVRESAAFIAGWLAQADADVILTQENARAGPVNLWVDLKGAVDAALPGHASVFYPDFQTRLLPPPFRIRNGQATYARSHPASAEVWPLPADGDPYDGPLRRRYAALATRIDGPGGCWTVVNVHTSAFDENAALRRRQVEALLARGEAERAQGRRVLIGGDFNLRLAPTGFAHDTEDRHLFWVHDFPRDALPPGWRIVADPAHATVRTNERPFQAGRNYTTIIDGFLVPPEVEVVSVQGFDMGFRHSDHQPVKAVFRAVADGPGCMAEEAR